MVAIINYGSSIYGAISYNQEKVDMDKAKIIHTHKMIKNIDGPEEITFSQTLRSFEDYLAANKRTKKPIAHISLNPSPEDKLSDAELSLMADTYMERMGYKDQPYIVYKHQDIDRKHIHIVTVRIDEKGNKISDSKDWSRSMDACRDLEIMFNLKQITDKPNEEVAHFLKKVDYQKGDIKRQIANTIKTLMKNYTFQTFGEYNALLSCYNINAKLVKGEEEGNKYSGVIYCATDEKGELKGNPIKSSKIGKSVGYDAINKKLAKNTENAKKNPIDFSVIKNIILKCMQNTTDKEKFVKILKSQNIDVVFRENQEGRIYGVTFVDHNKKGVFNGSRLGKEFSANVFNNQFSHSIRTDINKKQMPESENKSMMNEVPPILVDEIFGAFYLNTMGYDPEEEAFKRKLKKKKRKRI